MVHSFKIGDMTIQLTQKDVKNVHLSVHPPDGRVTLVTPKTTRSDVARAYAISKLGWIRDQQRKLSEQTRETPRKFIERASHYVWGRRYLMSVVFHDAKPSVRLDHKRITLTVRTGSDKAQQGEVLHQWHKSLLHQVIPPIIEKCSATISSPL